MRVRNVISQMQLSLDGYVAGDDGALDHPDGICVDEDGAVWYGDVGNKHCVRLAEGREVLQTIDLDRGCFACTLGAKTEARCSCLHKSGMAPRTCGMGNAPIRC
jgi:sugar lactone lactonase YvrE